MTSRVSRATRCSTCTPTSAPGRPARTARRASRPRPPSVRKPITSIRLRIAIAVAGAALAGFAVANAVPSGPGAGKVNDGVVDVALTPASGAVRLADAAIGDRTEGTLTVTNTGNLPVTATLTGSFTGDARLAGQVFVTVSGPGGVLLAARPLSTFDAQAGGLALGRLAACPGRSCDPGNKAPVGG